jgi:hypothetical protein
MLGVSVAIGASAVCFWGARLESATNTVLIETAHTELVEMTGALVVSVTLGNTKDFALEVEFADAVESAMAVLFAVTV